MPAPALVFPRAYQSHASPSIGTVLDRSSNLALGLVAAYPFNEAAGTLARDYSGNARHLTSLHVAQASTWETGLYGMALKFTAANTDQLGPVTYTMGGQDANHFTVFVVAKANTLNTQYNVWGGGSGAEPTVGFTSTGQVRAVGTGNASLATSGTNSVPNTGYNAIALLRHGTAGGFEIWINGTQATLGTNNTTTAYADGAIARYVGQNGSNSRYLDGGIACLYVWNRDLGAGEVKALMSDPYILFRPASFQVWMGFKPGALLTSSPTGGVTPTGTLKKVTIRAVSGVETPSATFQQVAKKSLAGTLTDTGTLAKQDNRALAGTLTDSGALTLQKVKTFFIAASLPSSGTLKNVHSLSLAGTLTAAGTLARTNVKKLAGTVTPVGTTAVVKGRILTLIGNLASHGTYSGRRLKLVSLTGLVRGIGTLARQLIHPPPDPSQITPIFFVPPWPEDEDDPATWHPPRSRRRY